MINRHQSPCGPVDADKDTYWAVQYDSVCDVDKPPAYCANYGALCRSQTVCQTLPTP